MKRTILAEQDSTGIFVPRNIWHDWSKRSAYDTNIRGSLPKIDFSMNFMKIIEHFFSLKVVQRKCVSCTQKRFEPFACWSDLGHLCNLMQRVLLSKGVVSFDILTSSWLCASFIFSGFSFIPLSHPSPVPGLPVRPSPCPLRGNSALCCKSLPVTAIVGLTLPSVAHYNAVL